MEEAFTVHVPGKPETDLICHNHNQKDTDIIKLSALQNVERRNGVRKTLNLIINRKICFQSTDTEKNHAS